MFKATVSLLALINPFKLIFDLNSTALPNSKLWRRCQGFWRCSSDRWLLAAARLFVFCFGCKLQSPWCRMAEHFLPAAVRTFDPFCIILVLSGGQCHSILVQSLPNGKKIEKMEIKIRKITAPNSKKKFQRRSNLVKQLVPIWFCLFAMSVLLPFGGPEDCCIVVVAVTVFGLLSMLFLFLKLREEEKFILKNRYPASIGAHYWPNYCLDQK